MSTLPGGRLAPPPPVTRVAAGGLAFLIASVFAFVWATTATLEKLSEPQRSQNMLSQLLREPYRQGLQEAQRTQAGSPVVGDEDLVTFSIDRSAARDVNVATVLAERRAGELYANGLPRDPGIRRRTSMVFPRAFLNVFTASRHKNLKPAKTAALIGAATGFLLCAVIATGAARFLLPGAAAGMGWMLVNYHLRLINFWIERDAPGGLLIRGQFRVASFDARRQLVFVTVTLVVAGMVFRSLRGPMRVVMRSAQRHAEAPAETANSEEAPA
ncbi:MAG: hypothetical protein QOK43_611 [Acidimicrobiaceae bacterium]|nr:hypothetical protein [Acidimicrobiaceae bacterium]